MGKRPLVPTVRTPGPTIDVDPADVLEVVRLLPDVLFRCHKGPDGKIYWSLNEGGLAEEFHLTTSEIQGMSLHDLFPGGASPELEAHFEEAFRGESTIFTNQIGDQHFRHFPQAIYGPDGNVEEVVGYIADVTDLVKTEEELRRTNAELDAYVGAVSHDLAQPLTVLRTLTTLLDKGLDAGDPDRLRDYVARLHDTVNRMAGMTEGLLMLSKARNATMTRGPVDVTAVAAALVEEQKLLDVDATIEVQADMMADGDETLVRQLLQNLINNAVRHGGDGVHIKVGHGDSPRGHAYSVCDDGPGIPASEAERIFLPFARNSDAPGHGIGLSTVMRIAVRHGGTAWVEPSPSGGACFWFTLA